jgi:acyl transferase domain-containing protein
LPVCHGHLVGNIGNPTRVLRSDPIGLQHQIFIAVYNTADNNVVSGDLKAIERLMAAVKRDGMGATKLAVAQGEHLISKL